jgi:hypothetical protein
MRLLSTILFALAAAVGVCALLLYAYLVNLACGYAPSGASCGGAPWDLTDDDRLWLVGLPVAMVTTLLVLAAGARRRSKR